MWKHIKCSRSTVILLSEAKIDKLKDVLCPYWNAAHDREMLNAWSSMCVHADMTFVMSVLWKSSVFACSCTSVFWKLFTLIGHCFQNVLVLVFAKIILSYCACGQKVKPDNECVSKFIQISVDGILIIIY